MLRYPSFEPGTSMHNTCDDPAYSVCMHHLSLQHHSPTARFGPAATILILTPLVEGIVVAEGRDAGHYRVASTTAARTIGWADVVVGYHVGRGL